MIQKQLLEEIKKYLMSISFDLYDIATSNKYKSLHNDYEMIEMYAKTITINSLINTILKCEEEKENE